VQHYIQKYRLPAGGLGGRPLRSLSIVLGCYLAMPSAASCAGTLPRSTIVVQELRQLASEAGGRGLATFLVQDAGGVGGGCRRQAGAGSTAAGT
jgi:hypothetical protein